MEYGRLASLQEKHRDLHQRIDALEAEKAPDKYVTPLKVKRLALKDMITKLKND
jgi:hypothetical protein